MAEIQIEGLNLGYTETPYDFQDRATGQQVTGVSRKLHLLVGLDKFELKVPDDQRASVQALPLNTAVVLRVGVPKGTRLELLQAVEV